MNRISEQKCPTCGAPVRFDPKAGKLVCDFCGVSLEIEAPDQSEKTPATGIEGFDFASLTDRACRPDAEALPVYNCVSCGAEVIAAAEQMTLTCPYCGNNIVLTDKMSGQLRPDAVLPFCIDPEELPAAVNRFYRGKKLLPKRFFSESTMGRVTGVYVPFWVFDGTIEGELTFSGEITSRARKGDYIVTDTSHYRFSRYAELSFAGVPVDASERVDDDLMDSLEPFDTAQAKDFDQRYLAGFTADRFDVPKSDLASRAEERMRTTALTVIMAEGAREYSNVSWRGGALRADLQARYMLMPVYLFDILYGGKNWRYAVNGQTGKVVGELPDSLGTNAKYFLLRAGILAGAVMLLSVIRYLLGWW